VTTYFYSIIAFDTFSKIPQHQPMSINTILEIITVVLSLTFLFLLIRENVWCWIFGIISSAISIYLFYTTKLYSESMLYFFYVLFGIYGWYVWTNPTSGKEVSISKFGTSKHLVVIVLGILSAVLLGYFFKNYTDANKSFVDAHTTVFSFIATYLEAHKYLYTWIYWLILNGVSIWLYYTQGLQIYGGLMVVYFIMSGVGFWNWRKKYLGVN